MFENLFDWLNDDSKEEEENTLGCEAEMEDDEDYDYDDDNNPLMDITGDGYADSIVSEFDLDGDGVIDTESVTGVFDMDGDGIADTVATERYTDLDGDGLIDVVTREIESEFDVEEVEAELFGETEMDDSTLMDLTGDGYGDSIVSEIDSDGDGYAETLETTSMYDTNGDGIEDTMVVERYTDIDGDGVYDAMTTEISQDPTIDDYEEENDFPLMDVTGDGHADWIVSEYDSDGDGVVDTESVTGLFDMDGDGVGDTVVTETYTDLDNDGLVDSVTRDIQSEYDVDEVEEALFGDDMEIDDSTMIDMTGDGHADRIVSEIDEDEDGYAETIETTTMHDMDGDGIEDTMVIERYTDTDGDGYADESSTQIVQDPTLDDDDDDDDVYYDEEVYEDPDFDAYTDEEDFYDEYEEDMDEYEGVPGYEPYENEDADDDDIIGTPEDDIDEWHLQETDCSCAIASQEFVLEQLTGEEYDEAELREIAEENGWYDPNGGTPVNDVGNLLEMEGLTVERSTGGSIEDIEECLNNGGKVIVSVDSDEIWYGENDDVYGPGMDADHAVEVIGIDYSNPDEPMVILNDSGIPNGAGAAIPLDNFVEAWEDGGCFMVEAYN